MTEIGQEADNKGQNRRRPGRPRTDSEIEGLIHRLAWKGWTPAQIELGLKTEKTLKERKLPHLRTIRRIVAQHGPRKDASLGWWSLADADAEDAALVLPVLAEMVKQGYGPRVHLNNEVAEWIVRVRLAAPDIPPSWALVVALNYWRLVKEREPTHGLDEMLAFAPWRSAEDYYDYLNEMGKHHSEWFDAFEKQESGHPMMGLPGALWSNPDAFGLVLAVEEHAQGQVPPPDREAALRKARARQRQERLRAGLTPEGLTYEQDTEEEAAPEERGESDNTPSLESDNKEPDDAEDELAKARAEAEFWCDNCQEAVEEPDTRYECGNCGEEFGLEENGSHKCPGCGKFAAKVLDHACPNCGEELAEGGNRDG